MTHKFPRGADGRSGGFTPISDKFKLFVWIVGLSYVTCPWWILLFESLEVFTLALMWVTAILYLRHLVPRRFTVTGQASAVVAHFCIGKFH